MCGPELSDIEHTIWQRYDQDEVIVLGINDAETLSTAEDFVRNFGLTYPVLIDYTRQTYYNYAVYGLSPYPRDIIIDQQGIVRYIHSEYDPQVMLETIDELLGYSSLKDGSDINIPQQFNLRAYPNPFNGQVRLNILVPDSEIIHLKIYDATGKVLIQQDLGIQHPGTEIEPVIDMSKYSSGVFFARINSQNISAVTKLVLIK